MARADFVHALVCYFDVHFSFCHKPVTLSTAPTSPATHWKQTVFYLDQVLTGHEGESVEGKMHFKPSEGNPRDLDVLVELSFAGRTQEVQFHQHYKLR